MDDLSSADRMDGVVPVAVKPMRREPAGGELVIGGGAALRIRPAIHGWRLLRSRVRQPAKPRRDTLVPAMGGSVSEAASACPPVVEAPGTMRARGIDIRGCLAWRAVERGGDALVAGVPRAAGAATR